MNINLGIGPLVSLIAGILILVTPRLLNFIVAIYLIIIGLLGFSARAIFTSSDGSENEERTRTRQRARLAPLEFEGRFSKSSIRDSSLARRMTIPVGLPPIRRRARNSASTCYGRSCRPTR